MVAADWCEKPGGLYFLDPGREGYLDYAICGVGFPPLGGFLWVGALGGSFHLPRGGIPHFGPFRERGFSPGGGAFIVRGGEYLARLLGRRLFFFGALAVVLRAPRGGCLLLFPLRRV